MLCSVVFHYFHIYIYILYIFLIDQSSILCHESVCSSIPIAAQPVCKATGRSSGKLARDWVTIWQRVSIFQPFSAWKEEEIHGGGTLHSYTDTCTHTHNRIHACSHVTCKPGQIHMHRVSSYPCLACACAQPRQYDTSCG